MARIIGVEVPPNKRIDIALRYIYGIGPSNSKDILARANIDPSIRAKDLTEAQLSQIVHAIQDGKYVIEGDLRREIGMNLKRLQGIKCYRGIRHLRGLPVRGQRTQTNARTRRSAWSAIPPPRPAFIDALFQTRNYHLSTNSWLTKKRNQLRKKRPK